VVELILLSIPTVIYLLVRRRRTDRGRRSMGLTWGATSDYIWAIVAAGIWVQAVLFLFPHLALLLVSPLVWPILPAQFLTGLALGWLRSRHDSIAPTIAVHAVVNVITGLIV
jgi:membrane protease YdiL (CAAX protease family)